MNEIGNETHDTLAKPYFRLSIITKESDSERKTPAAKTLLP